MYSRFHDLFHKAQEIILKTLGENVTLQNTSGSENHKIRAYVANTPAVVGYSGNNIGPAIAVDVVAVQFRQADVNFNPGTNDFVFFEDRPNRPRVSVRSVKQFSSGNTLLICAWSPL